MNPISSFEADDGEDNAAEDENLPSSMKFTFDATPTGSRLTIVTRFSSVEAMELTIPAWKKGYARRCPNSTRCWLNEARPPRTPRTNANPGTRRLK